MEPEQIRKAVQKFREDTGFVGPVEDAFAPWYLQYEFSISKEQAQEQSSDGNYDFGIDGFNIAKTSTGKVSLVLIQAKLSESLRLVSQAFKDLERALPEARKLIEAVGSDVSHENKVLTTLRASLNKLSPEERASLELELRVIHLSNEDEDIIGQRISAPLKSLKDVTEDLFHDHAVRIRHIRPCDMGPAALVVAPPLSSTITLDAVESPIRIGGAKMYFGVGRLSELVDMYTTRRDNLFKENVRYYLYGTREEKGPAGRIKETLKRICSSSGHDLEPAVFALYHNGITIHGTRVEAGDGRAKVFQPYVLNGCQSIKAAFYFRNDPKLKAKIDDFRWRDIPVPIRIIESRDEDLVRRITINNNHQNAIQPVALRANDPVQIRLENRFKDWGVFYERQEGAFENLQRGQADTINAEYPNTKGRALKIEELGRVLAAAAGELSLAQHPKDLFESDAAYSRSFSEKRTRSVAFMVFLHNIQDVMGTVLNADLNLSNNSPPFSPGRLKYHALYLLVKSLAKEGDVDFALEYGGGLFPKSVDFRERVKLKLRGSGVWREIREKFMALDGWDAKTVGEALKRAEGSLHLTPVDAFERFQTLDSEHSEWVAEQN